MTAGAYCNREVIITGPDTNVIEAARLMRKYHVGDLVVVEKGDENNIPIGILTDRDLVVEVLAQEVSPETVSIRDIMSSELVIVTENENLLDTLHIMRKHSIRRIPVVDSAGSLKGILSEDDVIELIAEATNDLVSINTREIVHEAQRHP